MPDWSPWSRKYDASGARVTSPGLRRFMQIQARLVSDNREAAPALERISVQLHNPVAQDLRAELWPAETTVGVLDTFEIFMRPGFLEEPAVARQPGFDELLLRSEPSWDMDLLQVAVGTEDEFVRQEPGVVYEIRQGSSLANATGEVVEVLRDQGDSVWVHFPQLLQSQSVAGAQTYYRNLLPGDQVPVAVDGEFLTETSHALLPIEEQGAIRYFSLLDAAGTLAEVDFEAYDALGADERGPVRYFRVVSALGDESSYDELGDLLTSTQYNRLSSEQQGGVVGRGDLVRLRFASRVFLQGSNVKVAVRHSAATALWQEAQAGDITVAGPGNGLEIQAMGGRGVVDQVQVAPNPFTPNGDSINDQTTISFSLFKVHVSRPVKVSLFRLDGRRVRTIEETVSGGAQSFVWDGRDDQGALVPPGLYIAQIDAATDAADVSGQQVARLVGVAY